MGLPITKISFEQLAQSAVPRSARGIVALLLSDTTGSNATATYSREADVATGEWTADSVKHIKMALRSGAFKVLCVRMVAKDGADDVTATLESIRSMIWNWAVAPGLSAPTEIVAWIKEARAKGKPFKAVVGGAATPNCEGIVNLTTLSIQSNIMGSEETYTPALYTPRVAGILASAPLDQSVTGFVFEDVLSATPHTDADAAIDAGEFVIVFNGASYECGRAVTSLTTTKDIPALFKKIKHVEGSDLITTDIASLFKANYKGQKVNSYNNKQSFVAQCINYFKDLRGSVLSPDYAHVAMVDYDAQVAYLRAQGMDTDLMSETEILMANTEEEVFITAKIQLIDAMEDLSMTIGLV